CALIYLRALEMATPGTLIGSSTFNLEGEIMDVSSRVMRPTALIAAVLNFWGFELSNVKIATDFCVEYLLCPKRIWASATPAKRSKNIIIKFFPIKLMILSVHLFFQTVFHVFGKPKWLRASAFF